MKTKLLVLAVLLTSCGTKDQKTLPQSKLFSVRSGPTANSVFGIWEDKSVSTGGGTTYVTHLDLQKDHVTAAKRCVFYNGHTVDAEVTVPATVTASSVTIPQGDGVRVDDGGFSCDVAITTTGSQTFTIKDLTLT